VIKHGNLWACGFGGKVAGLLEDRMKVKMKREGSERVSRCFKLFIESNRDRKLLHLI
jgi:hypothetical protein